MSSITVSSIDDQMEEIGSTNIEVVIKSSDGIIYRDTKEITEKGEDIKTTEYFLDVTDQNDEGEETHYVAVEGECEENQEFVAVEVGNSGSIILHDKNVILWNELCRICANGSDRFIPIFSGEGLEHNLCNKIHTYLPLRISEEDNLPLQVCYNCAATLLAWDEMNKGCLDAQQRLTELQNKFELKDDYYTEPIIEEEGEEEEGENIEAELGTENSNNEEGEVEGKCVNSVETVQIVDVSESSRSHDLQSSCTNFKEFQKVYKPSLPIKSRLKSETTSKSMKKRTSRVIKKKPSKKLTIIKDESEIHTKIIEEQSDTKAYIFSSSLEMISDATHAIDNDDNELVDNDLEEEVPSPSENSKCKKSRRKRSSTGLECKQCNKKFRMYNSYQIHMRLHTGEKPYTCHICGKQFGQTGSLYYHLKHVHGGVKNHACDICGRCFAMKTAMEDHRRIHTGERPYVCDSCGKTFKTKASLYIHSKIHTNEYPFNCSYCKKLFRWKQQMISHLTTHTGEKNHICDICGKGFGVKNELTRHRRTHSLDKPFTCQKCGVSFGQKRYLTNHNRTRHKTKVASN